MQKHYIVGTAGHIDHGKTTLSKALTGKDTDRLKEEKARNISIELGFAPFKLPNNDYVSLIDVPGHEKFIRHMVAGVGGIDLVLLIIAADEGIMPQTKEHLQIIDLLGIEHGIIVLTKKDLVDQEFLDLVEEEVRETLKKSNLINAPIISVSSVTNEGIEELKQLIQEKLNQIPERISSGFFRMPIDRVFTLKGIGTVVTGTVYSGSVKIGQELEIMPSNHKVRIRSLQVHSNSVDEAFAGQRVAINLTGIELDEINRGDSIVTPNHWEPSKRIDVELNILDDIDFSIKQNSEVKFHIGTSEVLGTLIMYDRKEAQPGDTIYAQIKLEEPIISSRKDRFIIRRPSPSTTIGGGVVIEPNAIKHKYRQETIEQLKQKSKGTLEDLLLQQLMENEKVFLTLNDLSNTLILPENELKEELNKLKDQKKIMEFSNGKVTFFASTHVFNNLLKEIIKHLSIYHEKYPLRMGQPKAEFTKQFFTNLKPKIIQVIFLYLESEQYIKINEEYISMYDFQPTLPKHLQQKTEQLEKKLINQQLKPDSWDELTKSLEINEKDKIEIYNYLINLRKILKLTDKMVIHYQTFEKLKQEVTYFLSKEGQITLQQAKELLGVSRKYLVPLMELLDQEKVTVLRQGKNYRELRKQ
ncbi:selenocysteine-specific translation elongation factor [Vulcanibacillus modesticaldus]|uniref:Selenocysteine-specific elongation factor n=1 Tax=Vulcanibacillus modesticaldus TaxID=337097 RepID=A0A1D2YUE1_9BACI|nr:selenocysteine-specific translation elongation factor [Vulcanibacillus modesticaldus]OEF99265.1 selenocysteine-specific translation elongation factor [Vulcanibacillus modesticaldus]